MWSKCLVVTLSLFRARLARTASVAVLLLATGAAFAQAPVGQISIARGNEDYPPVEMHVDGKLTGFHVELIEAVAEKIGLEVKWLEVPWARAQNLAETGAVDAVTFLTPTAERETWAIFLPGNALSNPKVRFLIHKSSQGKLVFNGDQASFLKDKTLLTINGYFYSDIITATKKYETGSLKSLVDMMLVRRYEIAAVTESAFLYAYGERPEFNDLVLLDPPIRDSRAYLAFSKRKGNDALAARFESAMTAFKKTKKYAALLTAYRMK